MKLSAYSPKHFLWECRDTVATVTLNRPERKNPLTFESYAELRDLFRSLSAVEDVKAVVITGAGDNFCSGGDVHEIIGPLVQMAPAQRLAFTTMTGDLVKAVRHAPQIVIAAIDGVCVGAGAAIAMASDLRIGTERSKVAFLFTKVGLAGCDMGACALLPRIIGLGRAAELLYTGRVMNGLEALQWGFFNEIQEPAALLKSCQSKAMEFAQGPTFAHAMTKRMLDHEAAMSIDTAISAEAESQALCMGTKDFERAYKAFVSKEKVHFQGN